MNKERIVIWLLIGVIIIDVLRYYGMGGLLIGTSATYLIAGIEYISLFLLFNHFRKIDNKNIVPKVKKIFSLWIFIILFSIFQGIILAQTYWDWKYLFLQGIGFSIVPFYFIIGSQIKYWKTIIEFVFKRLFLIGFVLIPFSYISNIELYSRVMIPSTFFLLLIRHFSNWRKILLIIVIVISVITVLDFRTLQLKIVFALMLLLGFKLVKQHYIIIHRIIFAVPFFFVFAFIIYGYNIFYDGLSGNKENEYNVNVNNTESNLLADTRTFLYIETIASMDVTELFIGKGISGSYKSSFIGFGGGDENGKRYATEVGILNILLKYGALGIAIYIFLIYSLTNFALKKSNNLLTKVLALTIAFRWPLIFVEEFTQYDLNFVFFWLFLGLISNQKFTSLTDSQISDYFDFQKVDWQKRISK